MNTSHTHGPWSVMCDEARGKPRCLILDKEGLEVAAINPYREAWNQNAELIAAAPELLSACFRMLEYLVDHADDKSSQLWVEVRNAVAKAIDAEAMIPAQHADGGEK